MIDYFFKTWEYMGRTEIIVAVIIAGILLACLLLLLASVSRRLYNARKYHILDRLRNDYLPLFREITAAGKSSDEDLRKFKARPESVKWTAVEDDLFILLDEGIEDTSILMIFEKLGYVGFYRKMLDHPNVITQASAVARLGMIKDHHSAERLLEMFNKENVEITAVTVRAFCKIGEVELFPRFLTMLSDLLNKRLVSTKTIDTSLALVGPEMIPVLLKLGRECEDARIISSILKVLSNIPPDNVIYEFALTHLDHGDPEVRAKASRVIANFENLHGICNHGAWPRLLRDPVWFVRLQAVRAIGKQQCKDLVEHISALILDEKWQVRNAAVEALIGLEEDAIEIFLKILKSGDQYAKESICEVMQKTVFMGKLFAWLEEGNVQRAENIYGIFSVMVSLGFTSQLKDYLNKTKDRKHVVTIEKMFSVEVPS